MTTLQFYLTWWCRFRRHATPVWTVRAEGVGFTCPTCQRFKASPVLTTTKECV